uniref:Uncharacterized protein n=1 Tax=Rhizophora mucronata TaxID=61149 RepID=A0A2P2PAG0_RHIMU
MNPVHNDLEQKVGLNHRPKYFEKLITDQTQSYSSVFFFSKKRKRKLREMKKIVPLELSTQEEGLPENRVNHGQLRL